jgi:DNA-binding Lrp family transcriptional regulator
MDAHYDTTGELDRPMTIAQFANWLGVEEGWVRKRLRILPGVIIESRETVRIHPRTYLDGRLKSYRRSPRP